MLDSMSSTILPTLSKPFNLVAQRTKMHPILSLVLANLLSWRALAIILALLNLKSLPLAWHLRLFKLMIQHGRPLKKNISFLKRASSSSLKATQNRIHPIFRPVSISCRTSLYETDYNLHKSNSTYFADLDHSRTALVSSLLSPTIAHSTLKEHGEKPGVLYPILGSVHTSFLKEIKPLESYTVRSRLLAWDRKWLIILSEFVRPATRKEKAKAKRDGKDIGDEVLLASALNKYVLKQGRKTIEPGLALAGSGWFKANAGTTHAVAASEESQAKTRTSVLKDGDSSAVASGSSKPLPTPSQTSVDAAETVGKVVRRLSTADSHADYHNESATPPAAPVHEASSEEGGWTWTEINDQRLRGLKVAAQWLQLDSDLRDEYNASVDLY